MIEQPQSALLQKLLDYWKDKCGDREDMPVVGALDLLDAPLEALPFCLVVDVEPGGADPRFRFRYVGQEIVRRYGEDPTGRYLDELDFGATGQTIRRDYSTVVDTSAPARFFGEMRKQDGRWLRFERLLLPFSATGARVDVIMAGIVHEILSANN